MFPLRAFKRLLGGISRFRMEFRQRRSQRTSAAEDNRPLHKVLQLPDVSRPMPIDESLHDLAWDGLNFTVHCAGELPHKIPDQQRNILAPLTQRRHANGKNVQAVEKIAAEFFL